MVTVSAMFGSVVAAIEVKPHLTSWKEKSELARKLLTLLNAFTPPDIRTATFGRRCSGLFLRLHCIVAASLT